jgi:hypothetical protein
MSTTPSSERSMPSRKRGRSPAPGGAHGVVANGDSPSRAQPSPARAEGQEPSEQLVTEVPNNKWAFFHAMFSSWSNTVRMLVSVVVVLTFVLAIILALIFLSAHGGIDLTQTIRGVTSGLIGAGGLLTGRWLLRRRRHSSPTSDSGPDAMPNATPSTHRLSLALI